MNSMLPLSTHPPCVTVPEMAMRPPRYPQPSEAEHQHEQSHPLNRRRCIQHLLGSQTGTRSDGSMNRTRPRRAVSQLGIITIHLPSALQPSPYSAVMVKQTVASAMKSHPSPRKLLAGQHKTLSIASLRARSIYAGLVVMNSTPAIRNHAACSVQDRSPAEPLVRRRRRRPWPRDQRSPSDGTSARSAGRGGTATAASRSAFPASPFVAGVAAASGWGRTARRVYQQRPEPIASPDAAN
jgi:hypothetical protein